MVELLERLGSGRAFSTACEHPSGINSAYRLQPPVGKARGFEDGFFSVSDLVITVKNIEARRSFSDDEPGLGRLVFVYHLAGKRAVELGETGHHCLNGPTFAVYYQAKGVPKRSTWDRGEKEIAVTIGLWPSEPPELLRESLKLLPGWTGAENTSGGSFWFKRPMPIEMTHAAQQLISPQLHPSLVQHYLSLKAEELLCLGLDTFIQSKLERSSSESVRSSIQYAQSLINTSLRTPPTLQELSQRVGLPSATLSRELRNETGMNLSQYIAEMRMARAQHLLEYTNMPLKKIAFELGYNHTSNFCIAFKRHFSKTPKELRDAKLATCRGVSDIHNESWAFVKNRR